MANLGLLKTALSVLQNTVQVRKSVPMDTILASPGIDKSPMTKSEALAIVMKYGGALPPEIIKSLMSGKEIKMLPMKYKNFTFPHNPYECTYKSDRDYIMHKYPEIWLTETEDIHVGNVVITGTGEFFGPFAYEYWNALNTVYRSHGAGEFFHPVYKDVTMALMTKLEGTMEPLGNYIRYSFEFVQHVCIEKNIKIVPDYDNIGYLETTFGYGFYGSGEDTSGDSSGGNGSYTVKSGDCLWNIAASYYGDGSQYEKIYQANTDKISDPNLIYPGQVLTIP